MQQLDLKRRADVKGLELAAQSLPIQQISEGTLRRIHSLFTRRGRSSSHAGGPHTHQPRSSRQTTTSPIWNETLVRLRELKPGASEGSADHQHAQDGREEVGSESERTELIIDTPAQYGSVVTEAGSDALCSTAVCWSQVDIASVHESVKTFVEMFISETEAVEFTFITAQTHLQSRLDAMINAPPDSRGLDAEAVELFRDTQFIRNYALTCYSELLQITLLPAVNHNTRLPVFLIETPTDSPDAPAAAVAARHRTEVVSLSKVLTTELDSKQFVKLTKLNEIEEAIEKFHATHFSKGSRFLARQALLDKKKTKVEWEDVGVGVLTGLWLMCVPWIISTALSPAAPPHLSSMDSSRVFRVLGLLLVIVWSLAIQLYCWREWRVNFILLLFDGDNKWAIPTVRVLGMASVLSLTYSVLLLMYIKIASNLIPGIDPEAAVTFAYLVMGVVVAFVAVPAVRQLIGGGFRTPKHVLLFILGVSDISFLTAFVADYLTSSAKMLAEIVRLGCYTSEYAYLTFATDQPAAATSTKGGLLLPPSAESVCDSSRLLSTVLVPMVICWPLWLRFAQNMKQLWETGRRWPFLANAGKYLLNHTIVIFATLHHDLLNGMHDETDVDHILSPTLFRILFYTCFACVSLFAWVWDVKMDWGLGNKQHGYLRNKRMCPHVSWYYLAVVLDLFLRFVWTLTLIPRDFMLGRLTKYPTLLTAIELMRRCGWALLRVENEHLNNTRGYRHLETVPLYFDTPIVEKKKGEGGRRVGGTSRLTLEVAGGVVIVVAVTLGAALL